MLQACRARSCRVKGLENQPEYVFEDGLEAERMALNAVDEEVAELAADEVRRLVRDTAALVRGGRQKHPQPRVVRGRRRYGAASRGRYRWALPAGSTTSTQSGRNHTLWPQTPPATNLTHTRRGCKSWMWLP